MTKRWLDNHNVQYKQYNVEEDHEAMMFVSGMGFKSVPVVFWGKERWAGFQPDKLKESYEKDIGDIQEDYCPCGFESVRCTSCW